MHARRNGKTKKVFRSRNMASKKKNQTKNIRKYTQWWLRMTINVHVSGLNRIGA